MPYVHRRQNRTRRPRRNVQSSGQQHPDKSTKHRRRKPPHQNSPPPRVFQSPEFAVRPKPPQNPQQRRAKNDGQEQQHKHQSMPLELLPLYSSPIRLFLLALALLLLAGCAQRMVDITSDPSGALVFLNGNEVGRTPMRYDFTWYSDYDVTLRKDGYETLKTHHKIDPPLL